MPHKTTMFLGLHQETNTLEQVIEIKAGPVVQKFFELIVLQVATQQQTKCPSVQ